MRHLSKVVNIVPVIAKADTLTLEERDYFKQKVNNNHVPLNANSVVLYLTFLKKLFQKGFTSFCVTYCTSCWPPASIVRLNVFPAFVQVRKHTLHVVGLTVNTPST